MSPRRRLALRLAGAAPDHAGTQLGMGGRGQCAAGDQPGPVLVHDGHHEN
jgi:hypothetical protein